MGKPEQYNSLGLDAFDIMKANFTKEQQIAVCKFNIVKYAIRNKNQDLSDAKKIIDYAELLTEIILLTK